jgi:GNAT superfamily N-acetyltransferase
MRIRERHERPWRFRSPILFDLLHRLECRWARFSTRNSSAPDYEDDWGCPYWLEDEGSRGSLVLRSIRRKVGDVGISWAKPGEVYIHDIEIHHPRDRGLGLGGVLLERAIILAREQGATRVVGHVTNDDLKANPRLLDWYRHFGFEAQRIEPGKDVYVAVVSLELSTDSQE